MGICRGVPSILEDLQLVKLTVLFAVPTLHKKIYNGVHNLISSANPLLHAGRSPPRTPQLRRPDNPSSGKTLTTFKRMRFAALDRLALAKIRARFRGNLRYGVVAAVLNFLDNVGIPICEGYGLTETSPIISINTPYRRRPGYVGRVIPGVEVVVCDEGVLWEGGCYGGGY